MELVVNSFLVEVNLYTYFFKNCTYSSLILLYFQDYIVTKRFWDTEENWVDTFIHLFNVLEKITCD